MDQMYCFSKKLAGQRRIHLQDSQTELFFTPQHRADSDLQLSSYEPIFHIHLTNYHHYNHAKQQPSSSISTTPSSSAAYTSAAVNSVNQISPALSTNRIQYC